MGTELQKGKEIGTVLKIIKTETGLFWKLKLDSFAIKTKFGPICKKQNKVGKKCNLKTT